MSFKERDVSPAGSPRASLTAEENLPLYEEFHHTEADYTVPPSKKASPDEVRDFITRLLIHERGLPQDYVRRAAAKWTIGSGQELHSYTPTMYLDIFGREDGWIIYREVKLCIYRDQKKKFSARYGVYIALAVLALLETIFVSVACSSTNESVQVSAVLASMVGGMAVIGVAFACCITASTNPESWVESELRASAKTTQQI